MWGRPRDFGAKYGNGRDHNQKAEWINMKKVLQILEQGGITPLFTQSNKKYQTRNLMAYTDSGFKNSHPFTTNWLWKWIDVYKKIYLNGWPRVRPPLSRKIPKKGPPQTTIDPLRTYQWYEKYWRHKLGRRFMIR